MSFLQNFLNLPQSVSSPWLYSFTVIDVMVLSTALLIFFHLICSWLDFYTSVKVMATRRLVFSKGVFRKRRESIMWEEIASISFIETRMGKLFNYSDLKIKSKKGKTLLFNNIKNPERLKVLFHKTKASMKRLGEGELTLS